VAFPAIKGQEFVHQLGRELDEIAIYYYHRDGRNEAYSLMQNRWVLKETYKPDLVLGKLMDGEIIYGPALLLETKKVPITSRALC